MSHEIALKQAKEAAEREAELAREAQADALEAQRRAQESAAREAWQTELRKFSGELQEPVTGRLRMDLGPFWEVENVSVTESSFTGTSADFRYDLAFSPPG